jgi:hypothetical protein
LVETDETRRDGPDLRIDWLGARLNVLVNIMAGLISKKPIVGFATSLLFGALGALLIRIETSSAGLLFKIVGYFILFVAVCSFFNAVSAVVKGNRRNGR